MQKILYTQLSSVSFETCRLFSQNVTECKYTALLGKKKRMIEYFLYLLGKSEICLRFLKFNITEIMNAIKSLELKKDCFQIYVNELNFSLHWKSGNLITKSVTVHL